MQTASVAREASRLPPTMACEGDKILLSSPAVKNPTLVRYGWSGFTDADLRNKQGLPASTFYTKVR